MEFICIVDCEGCFFKQLDLTNKLVITEISFAIIGNSVLKEYGYYRLSYDLREYIYLFNNYKTYKFANINYPNTFQNRMYVEEHPMLSYEYVKTQILSILSKFTNCKVYAKGKILESLFFDTLDITDLNTFNKFPKFNLIQNKSQLLNTILSTHDFKVGKMIVLSLNNNLHLSLIECLIFLQVLINDYL